MSKYDVHTGVADDSVQTVEAASLLTEGRILFFYAPDGACTAIFKDWLYVVKQA